jgi:signal transduction histidine kinase
MKPRSQIRVQSRLLRVFLLQLALISAITVAGIFAASLVAERLLVNKALVGEADYFWKRRSENPSFALPDTLNLQSWYSVKSDVESVGDTTGQPSQSIPPHIASLPTGQHRVVVDGDDRIVYISERDGGRLYLLFQDETVSNLAFYFGVLPLTLVLLIMYSLAFLTYWLSKRAVSPIVRLAGVIERFDFNARDAAELDLRDHQGPADSETRVLAQALAHFFARSKDSIERERNFTRYASHELRTPIAVIQGSVSTLELAGLDGPAGRAVARIKRTSEHMRQLINSLLMLARDRVADQAAEDERETVEVTELLAQLIEELEAVSDDDSVSIELLPSPPMRVTASAAVVSIVLGNILRNAWNYTDKGVVRVTVKDSQVSIEDSGRGLDAEQQRRIFEPFYRIEKNSVTAVDTAGRVKPTEAIATQHKALASGARGSVQGLGLGLAIVRHFCEQNGWQLTLESAPGVGSTFTVDFHP